MEIEINVNHLAEFIYTEKKVCVNSGTHDYLLIIIIISFLQIVHTIIYIFHLNKL